MAENELPDNEMWSGGTPGAPATRAELDGIIAVRLAEIETRLSARLEKLAGPGLSHAELLARFALDEHEHEDYAGREHDHFETYAFGDHEHEDHADRDHDHDRDYAEIDHDHDSEYASAGSLTRLSSVLDALIEFVRLLDAQIAGAVNRIDTLEAGDG